MSANSFNSPFPSSRFNLYDAVIALSGFILTAIAAIFLYLIRIMSGIDSVSGLLGISHDTLSILLEYFFSGVILAIIFFFIIRRYRLNWLKFGFVPVRLWQTIGWVFGGFLVTFIGWIIITPIFIIFLPQVDLAESQEIFRGGMTFIAQLLLIFYAVILGPFIEEIIFRGIVLPAISNRFNFIIGIIISTGIWSMLHFQVNIIIFTSIFGIVLSYMYYRTQSLWPSFLTHVVKNLIAVIALYLIGL